MLPFSESLLSLIPPPDNSSTSSVHVCYTFTTVACRPGAIFPCARGQHMSSVHVRARCFVLNSVSYLQSGDLLRWKTCWILIRLIPENCCTADEIRTSWKHLGTCLMCLLSFTNRAFNELSLCSLEKESGTLATKLPTHPHPRLCWGWRCAALK